MFAPGGRYIRRAVAGNHSRAVARSLQTNHSRAVAVAGRA